MLRLEFISIIIGLLIVGASSAVAQNSQAEILAVAKQDGRAFVYHNQTIPLSHGYNVYRSQNGQDWQKLTEKPFYAAGDGYEFQKMIGDQFAQAARIADREDPQGVFLRLRQSSHLGIIASMSTPVIAKAVGRLFIDENAPIGQTVYYRFEIIDDLGRPVDQQIQGQVDLQPVEPPAPSQLQITNEAQRVTATWNYVPQGTPEAQHVIRFRIFYRQPGSDVLKEVNEEHIARTIESNEFQYNFEVPQLGREYIFSAYAVDFTGQLSAPSNEVATIISENVAPGMIYNVQASLQDTNTTQITWPVATDLDLGGYYLYRARSDEEEYQRINAELIPPLNTAYTDSTVQPGEQYRYKVTAVDTLGNEGEKSNAANVFVNDYRVPEPVQSIRAAYNKDNTVRISWEGVEVPGGFQTYMLLRWQINPPGGNSYTQLNSGRLTETSLSDPGVGDERFVEGTTFEYGIAVIGENGNRSDTVYTKVKIPDLTPPEPPSFVEAQMEEARRVSLKWPASTSRDVTRYRVYRGTIEASTDTMLAELSRSDRYFRDEAVPLGKSFIYKISAVDSVNNESTRSAQDTLITRRMYAPPSARNVQVLAIEEGVQLAWEEVSDEQVVGYKIYRAEIATGIYEQVGQIEAGLVRWTDSNGKAGLWYKVFPVDASGREARSAKATQAVSKN